MKILTINRAVKVLFVAVAILIIISSLLSGIFLPEIFRRGISSLNQPYRELIYYVIVFVSVLIVLAIIKAANQYSLLRIQKSLNLYAEKNLLNEYLSLCCWQEGIVPDDTLHRIRKDIPEYVQNVVSVFTQTVTVIALIIFCSIYVISLSPLILLLGVGVTIIAMLVSSKFSNKLPDLMQGLRGWMGKLHMIGWEQVANREISPLLQIEKVSKIYIDSVDQYSKFQLKILTIMNITQKMQDITTGLVTIGIALIGGNMVLTHKIEIADILAILIVLTLLITTVFGLPSLWTSFKSAEGIKKRLYGILQTAEKEPSEKIVITSIENIEFDNVSAHYLNTGNTFSFSETLSAAKNELICIKGESGIGKSTIFRLLMKLLPIDSGEYRINNISFNQIDRYSFWNNTLYLQQEPQIINDSIFNNITLFKHYDYDDKYDIALKALEKVGLSEYVLGLEKGLETNIMDLSLSSGQLQRLCLARVFYHDFDLLLLDEPTSKIDPFSENKIIENIINEVRDKNIICIVSSHNKSFDSYASRVIQIERCD